MDPCRQEPRLNHLEDELAAMVRDIRDDQKRQTKLLENIAMQGGRISGLEDIARRHDKALDELFKRAREYDKLPGAIAVRALLVVTALGSSTVSGVLVWFITKG